MDLTSSAFSPNGALPARYTCEGAGGVPPLAWSDVPAGTRSLVLIVDDPDAPDPRAPRRTWVHWVIYDLSPETPGLPEGGQLPTGTRHGLNDRGRTGWDPPCPPVGRHRYVFKLYALDIAMGELATPAKAALEAAMDGHVLAHAQLIGTYEKQR